MNAKTKQILLALLMTVVIVGLFMWSQASSPKPQTLTGKLQATASFYPLYDFAKNIAGDKAQVTNITPAGTEPHDFEPAPTTLVKALQSNLFLYNGANFEPWTDNFLADYKNIAVKASQDLQLDDGDPHFWLDPTLATQAIGNILRGFNKADPLNAKYYDDQANKYVTKLMQLDADFRLGLASCKTRTIITAHDAFGYLGKRYNLTIEPIAGISPEQEPSAAKLAELTKLVKEKNIKYVFFEALVSPKLAQTIAAETGAKTLVLDPIEGITNADQQKGKDYVSVQRQNLANLRTALACK